MGGWRFRFGQARGDLDVVIGGQAPPEAVNNQRLVQCLLQLNKRVAGFDWIHRLNMD